jgi:hypothetical protein
VPAATTLVVEEFVIPVTLGYELRKEIFDHAKFDKIRTEFSIVA